MIWDKLFWLWFLFIAAMAITLLFEEATTFNIMFGSMLVGLGLIKLAGERSGRKTRVSKKILDRLKK